MKEPPPCEIKEWVVTTKEQAWAKINSLFPNGYTKDENASEFFGYDTYDIHNHITFGEHGCISDLSSAIFPTNNPWDIVISGYVPHSLRGIINIRIDPDRKTGKDNG